MLEKFEVYKNLTKAINNRNQFRASLGRDMAATWNPKIIPSVAAATVNKKQRIRDWAGPRNTASGVSSGEDSTPATMQMSVASTTNKETLLLTPEGTAESEAAVAEIRCPQRAGQKNTSHS